MVFRANDRVEAVPGAVRTDLDLRPEEFFLLTRIEGPTEVRTAAAMAGLSAEEALRILARLERHGLVRCADAPSAAPSDGAASNRHPGEGGRSSRPLDPLPPRQRALKAHFASLLSQAPSAAGAAHKRAERDRAARGNVGAPANDGTGEIDLVPPDDPELDAGLDLPVAVQRRVLAIHRKGKDATPFQVLGIPPTDDEKRIRRAYFDASRTYHPDRYYGKDLGRFGPILARLFERARKAYQELMDPAVRRRLLEGGEPRTGAGDGAALRGDAEDAVAREAAHAATAGEADAERQARQERDLTRRRRMQDRLRRRLREKARAHFDRGRKAEEQGDWSNATVSYRLAMEIDPGNTEYMDAHARASLRSRAQRAEKYVTRGWNLVDTGQIAEAVEAFRTAAELNPSPQNLAQLAWLQARSAPEEAYAHAMRALEALGSPAPGLPLPSAVEEARVRALAAHGLRAAGKPHLMAEQVERARELAGDDPQVRRFLKSLSDP